MPDVGASRGIEPTETDEIAAEQAKVVARELLETARRGGTEANFRRETALILDRAAMAAGLTIMPGDEFVVACGRVDSLYNRLILEYKKPGVLGASNFHKANVAVIQQVKDYLRDVARREKREAARLAAVATDGFFYIFIRQVGEGWSVDDPMPVNSASTALFLRLLFSLCTGAALVPENLVEDFKSDSPFYSMFNIEDYTFAPHKVVIREIAGGLTCATAGAHEGKPLIPDHKFVMVPFETAQEAHYVCALLNSATARLFVNSYVINTQFSPHLFEKLAIPEFDVRNKYHGQLSELSKHAPHAVRNDQSELASLTDKLDRLAAKVRDLDDDELSDVMRSVAEMEQ